MCVHLKFDIYLTEPCISEGGVDIEELQDKWTLVSTDGSRSAQFEHTILVQENNAVVLTAPNES